MRNRKSLRMVLTERDFAALVLVSEFGYVFARQFWVKVWPETKTISMSYDRLGLMVGAGFLSVVRVPGIREKFYTVTKEGFHMAQVKHDRPLPKKRPSVRQAFHQTTLLDLRIKLESLGVSDWKVGEVLRVAATGKDQYHVPDSTYINKKGLKVALEYDRSRRSNERIKSRLNFYNTLSNAGSISGLLYIVESSLLEVYEKLIKAHGISRVVLRTVDQIMAGEI